MKIAVIKVYILKTLTISELSCFMVLGTLNNRLNLGDF